MWKIINDKIASELLEIVRDLVRSVRDHLDDVEYMRQREIELREVEQLRSMVVFNTARKVQLSDDEQATIERGLNTWAVATGLCLHEDNIDDACNDDDEDEDTGGDDAPPTDTPPSGA